MDHANWEKERSAPYSESDIDHASYPYPSVHPNLIKDMQAALKGKRNIKWERDHLARMSARAGDDAMIKIETEGQWNSLKKVVSKLKSIGKEGKYIAERLDDLASNAKRLQAAGIHNEHEMRQALREYLPMRGKSAQADPVKKAERELIGRKLPGFFPTPPTVIDRMLAEAEIDSSHSVLEPSAGKGDIIDAIKTQHDGANVKGLEFNRTLQGVLDAKGHDIEYGDFMEHKGEYDRIVMNPPFENRADAQHTRHAYDNLKKGGKLVSLVSSGTMTASTGEAKKFQDWLDSVGGHAEPLPEGSFKGKDSFRQTGVNVHLVVIEK